MRDAFVKQLNKLAEKDKKIFFITADLGFGVFDEFSKRFPNQYLNVGVAEQNMTGIATALALEGRKVFTYSIANFATLRCLEQIRNDASYHEANITIVASGGGFTYGGLGMSHHATEDIAIMRALPGIRVVAPCTAWETFHATRALAFSKGVNYLRIEKGGDKKPPKKNTNFRIGRAIEMMPGKDITIIATGGILKECIKASKTLLKDNIFAQVVSMHSIKPLDEKFIRDCARKTKRIITVEEHNKIGGLGSAVSEVLSQNNLDCHLKVIALDDVFSSVVGSQDYLRSLYKLDHKEIIKSAKKMLKND
ncbi:MAG: transketolase [Rickettsiales bacterium TMED289]|nr:MAG: transketolase [Rickettsiales bacterium TMED289]|tara:strand:- start:179 stop:1102 length:924 start_codon:yes stop_codon:yes gene_type:complete